MKLLISLLLSLTTLLASEPIVEIDTFLNTLERPVQEEALCKDKIKTNKEYLECLKIKTDKDPTTKNINFLAGVYAVKRDLKKAIETYEINVAKGDKKAIYYMAGIINEGLKEHQRALPYFEKIKDYKDSTCQIGGIKAIVGDESWFEYKNKANAKKRTLEFYDKEINERNLKAYGCKGLYYISLKEYKKARDVYQLGIDNGDVSSMFYMGQLYARYIYNPKRSLPYYKSAASMGEAQAAHNLGSYYTRDKKFNEARKWYIKAINLGNDISMMDLAITYIKDKKYDTAEKILMKLGDLGTTKDGYSAIGTIYLDNGDYKKAEEKWQFCIDKGNWDCGAYIGALYKDKYKDKEKAIEWYEKAYKNGSITGALNLGALYRETKEFEKAKKWNKIAYEGGDAGGAYNMGRLYLKDLKDKEMAIIWMKKAAELGNENAIMHLQGWGEWE